MQKELPNSSIRIDNEAFGWRCLTVLVLIVLTPRAETLSFLQSYSNDKKCRVI